MTPVRMEYLHTLYVSKFPCVARSERKRERERERERKIGEERTRETASGGAELWQGLHCVCSVGIITKYRFEVFRVFVLRRAKSPVETINLAL